MNSIADVWEHILKQLENEMSATTVKTWFGDTTAIALEGDTLLLHCTNDPSGFKRSTIEQRFLGHIKSALRELFSADFEVKVLNDREALEHGAPILKPTSLLESGDFTFSSFVVGPSNKLAYAAACAVAEHPAEKYNPLFIYGDSGLGKTHLIYAIAHELRKQNPAIKIAYVKGDDFTNELVQAIREGTTAKFREKYRTADLLLMDDVQFIAGKTQTQEEFFHSFNTLFESKKQIVLTSDRPPKEMSQLEDRLRTRFEWGLLVDVQAPDFETRLAIIKNKATSKGAVLSENIANYIAENVTANVRQLEGTINKVLAYQELLDKDLDEEDIDRAIIDEVRRSNEYVVTAGTIIAVVSKYFDIEEETLRSRVKTADVANARQIAMYLIRRMTKLSQGDIAKEFGKKDHTTVIYSLEVVEKRIATDVQYAETVKNIISTINSRK